MGCGFVRQKGDHRIYWRDGLKRPVVFPVGKDIPEFIIRTNLKTLGISFNDFKDILKNL